MSDLIACKVQQSKLHQLKRVSSCDLQAILKLMSEISAMNRQSRCTSCSNFKIILKSL